MSTMSNRQPLSILQETTLQTRDCQLLIFNPVRKLQEQLREKLPISPEVTEVSPEVTEVSPEVTEVVTLRFATPHLGLTRKRNLCVLLQVFNRLANSLKIINRVCEAHQSQISQARLAMLQKVKYQID